MGTSYPPYSPFRPRARSRPHDANTIFSCSARSGGRRRAGWISPGRRTARQPEKRHGRTAIHQRPGLRSRGRPVHRGAPRAPSSPSTLRTTLRPAGADRPKVESIDEKIASLLGIEAKQLLVNDLAVNPISGNTYLGVTRGRAADGTPVLLRVDRAGKLTEVPLKDVPCARTALPNPGRGRQPGDVITHMAYLKGRVYVACLSNEQFASQFRVMPFPFAGRKQGNGSRNLRTARTMPSKPSRPSAPSYPTRSKARRTCWRPTLARRSCKFRGQPQAG